MASCDESQISPYELEEWRKILARFHLYDRLPFEGRLPIIRRMGEEDITSPWAFAKFSFAEATLFAARLADSSLIMALWQFFCVAFTSERAEWSIIPFRQSASMVAQKFRVKDIDDSGPAKRRAALIDSLELGTSFESMGQVAKIHRLANSEAGPSQLIDFASVSEELNITRQTIDSLPIAAGGIAW